MPKSHLGIGAAVGVSLLALGACDQAPWNPTHAPEHAATSDASSTRIACVDPETGELIQPGPGVDCRVPAKTAVKEEPVVRDLEDGGKAIDLKGRQEKHQVSPASQNRMAVIDRKTGKLMTRSEDDARAAARYDRSIARARNLMRTQSSIGAVNDDLQAEPLSTGGVKIDLKSRLQRPLVAKLSKDGQVRLHHMP